jgi:hypothetical protein
MGDRKFSGGGEKGEGKEGKAQRVIYYFQPSPARQKKAFFSFSNEQRAANPAGTWSLLV